MHRFRPAILLGLLAIAVASLTVAQTARRGSGSRPSISENVTFSRDVAPILYENCTPCHRPGGSAPFPLLSYEDARDRAPLIAAVTRARYMPPWLPAPGEVELAGERRLTNEQIEILQRWAEQGAVEGDPADLPSVPEYPDGWQLGKPDFVVEMEASYALSGGAHEEFRNFVLPVPITEDRWVAAVELRFDTPRVVHHASLMVDETDSSRRRDAEDSKPGYDGMGTASEARSPMGFFLGWTPGKLPSPTPADVAWRLRRGSDLVLQLHMRPLAEPTDVRGSIGLHFADGRPERTAVLLRLGSESLDIPPGAEAYAVVDSFAFPTDVEVLGLYPHAHYLAREMRVTAELPGGDTVDLLHIPRWDFNWQDEYRYEEPVRLPRGTMLRMRYTYDNTARNPHHPTGQVTRVTYGPHSIDEMADLMIQVVPLDRADAAELARHARFKNLAIHLEGLEAAARWRPEDPRVRYDLGAVLAAFGRWPEAIAAYREALRLRPDYPRAHNMLGIALQTTGRLDEAIRHYRLAMEGDPSDPRPAFNLGLALEAEGNVAEAVRHYRLALDADPDYSAAHLRLAEALRAAGLSQEAVEHYRRAIEGEPDDARARLGLGFALGSLGRPREALIELREAARLDPSWPVPLAAMAELLAGHPDPAVRDPAEAVRLAERAADLTARRDPHVLAVLAAAQAAAGRFEAAAATAETALGLASAAGARDLAESLRRSLERYRRGRS